MDNAILSFRVRLAIAVLGIPLLGFLAYVINQVYSTTFMELAQKLAM